MVYPIWSCQLRLAAIVMAPWLYAMVAACCQHHSVTSTLDLLAIDMQPATHAVVITPCQCDGGASLYKAQFCKTMQGLHIHTEAHQAHSSAKSLPRLP